MHTIKKFVSHWGKLGKESNNKILLNVKAKVYGYVMFIELCRKYIYDKNFTYFIHIKYEVTDTSALVIDNDNALLGFSQPNKSSLLNNKNYILRVEWYYNFRYAYVGRRNKRVRNHWSTLMTIPVLQMLN